MKTEDGRRKTEDGRQKTEDGSLRHSEPELADPDSCTGEEYPDYLRPFVSLRVTLAKMSLADRYDLRILLTRNKNLFNQANQRHLRKEILRSTNDGLSNPTTKKT